MRAFWSTADIERFRDSIHGPCTVLKICESNFYLEYLIAPRKAPRYPGAHI